MSPRNPRSNSKTCDSLSQSSSPTFQENETLVQEVNDFDHEEMKMETGENKETHEETPVGKKTIRIISSGKMELQEVDDDADFELPWKINVNGETPVEKNTIRRNIVEKDRIKECQTLEQVLGEDANWKKMSQIEGNGVVETADEETQTKEEVLKEDDNEAHGMVQGKHSAVLSFIQTAAEEEEQDDDDDDDASEDDASEAILSQLLVKEGYYSTAHLTFQDQTLPNSGFNFQHLKILGDIPFSSFYGVNFDNPELPLEPSSQIGSFYGLDTDSLAAENAALDDFYAKRKCRKDAFESDQSSGCHHSEDRNLDILFPSSTSEQDDDITTMKYLYTYKLYDGPLPYLFDQPAPTLGPQHPLLVHINSNFQKSGCISESRLTNKVLKLQTKYKNLVAEKGKSPTDQEFSTPDEFKFFRLSKMTWEQNQESDPKLG